MRLVIVCVLMAALAGCGALQPAERYQPSEMFGDGGATRCGVIHQHKTLPPCE